MQVHDPRKLLDNLRSQSGEREWLEFKENNFSPKSAGEYISALANSAVLSGRDCAYLVYGVENGTHRVVGTEVRLQNEAIGTDTFLFWVSKLLSPSPRLEVVPLDIDGMHVEIVLIEPSFQQPMEFQGKAFIRVDSSIRALRDYPDRQRALWLASSRYTFEDAVAFANKTPEWVLSSTLPRTIVDGLGVGRATAGGVIDLLVSEGMLLDNFQGGLDATNLLGITIAKQLADWPTLTSKAPRVVAYKGVSNQTADKDVTGALGYAAAFPKLLEYIMGHVTQREEIKHGIRKTVFDIPEIAIREFLANAFVHQDFTEREGGPFVEIFKDRVRISNPGRPLIDPDRFIDAPPRSRNPKLGSLMRRLGICEQRGSGVDRAVKAIEAAMLPPPLFQVVENSTAVTIFAPRPFATLTREDRIRACYQHACVQQEANEPMSNSSLRARFGLSERQYSQVSIVIRDAIEAGRIRPLDEDQANRNARYVPFWA